MKRGTLKNKTHLPTGDFIALGNKSMGQTNEVKSEIFPSISKVTPILLKSHVQGEKTGIPKLAVLPLNLSKALLSYESKGKEVLPSKFLENILQAHKNNNLDLCAQLIFGAIKTLKKLNIPSSSIALGLNFKPEINPVLPLAFLYLAKQEPSIFLYNNIPEALCSVLQKENYQSGPAIHSKLKLMHYSHLSIIVCNVLYAIFKEEEDWPEMFIKVYADDAMCDRIWVDNGECKGFVENIATAFETKYPKTSTMFPLVSSATDDEAPAPQHKNIFTIGDVASKKSEPCPVFPRYLMLHDQIEFYIVAMVTEYFSRRQPFENVSKSILKFLLATSGYSKVRLIAAQRIEIWLHNPKLTLYAQDLLMAICANLTRTSSEDLEVISAIVKLRFKNKPNFLQHYIASLEELLATHPENFGTVFKHIIYNELSSARNPNNMTLISFLIQYSQEASAKTLGEVFINLLCSKEDYTRALKALYKEIVRVNKHVFDFITFCRTLQQNLQDYPLYLEMDVNLKERFFTSQIELLSFSYYLTFSPKVKESANLLSTSKDRSTDVSSAHDTLKSFKLQLSQMQLDNVTWLTTKAPQTYENTNVLRGKTEFYNSVTKLFLLSDVDCHQTIKEIWGSSATLTDAEKALIHNVISQEVPLKLETIQGLADLANNSGYLTKANALNLIHALVSRASTRCIKHRTGTCFPIFEDEEVFDFGNVHFLQLEDMLLRLTTLDISAAISSQFSQDFECCPIAQSDPYWRACLTLLILIACRPGTYGDIPWNSNLTLRLLMEICLSGTFDEPDSTKNHEAVKSITPAQARALENCALREIQSQIMAAHTNLVKVQKGTPTSLTVPNEKEHVAELLKEFSYLDHNAYNEGGERRNDRSYLILLPVLRENTIEAKRVAPPRSFLTESMYHFSPKTIPKNILEELKRLNGSHKIGFKLCSCRDPDFLLSLIGRDGARSGPGPLQTSVSSSCTWLSNMIENNELDIINVVPVDCLCEYLFNQFRDFEDNDTWSDDEHDPYAGCFIDGTSFQLILELCKELLLRVTHSTTALAPSSSAPASLINSPHSSKYSRIVQIVEKLFGVLQTHISPGNEDELQNMDNKSATTILEYFGSKLLAEDSYTRNKGFRTLALITAYDDFKRISLDFGSSPKFLGEVYSKSVAPPPVSEGDISRPSTLRQRFKMAVYASIFENAPVLWFANPFLYRALHEYVGKAVVGVEMDKGRIRAYLEGLFQACTTYLVKLDPTEPDDSTQNESKPKSADERADPNLLRTMAHTVMVISDFITARYQVLKRLLKQDEPTRPTTLSQSVTTRRDALATVLIKIMVVFMQETLRSQRAEHSTGAGVMHDAIRDLEDGGDPDQSWQYVTAYKIEQSHFLPRDCSLIVPHKVITANILLLIVVHDHRQAIDNFEELEHFTQFWFPNDDSDGHRDSTLSVHAYEGNAAYAQESLSIMTFIPPSCRDDMLLCSGPHDGGGASPIATLAIEQLKKLSTTEPSLYYHELLKSLNLYGLPSSTFSTLLTLMNRACGKDYNGIVDFIHNTKDAYDLIGLTYRIENNCPDYLDKNEHPFYHILTSRSPTIDGIMDVKPKMKTTKLKDFDEDTLMDATESLTTTSRSSLPPLHTVLDCLCDGDAARSSILGPALLAHSLKNVLKLDPGKIPSNSTTIIEWIEEMCEGIDSRLKPIIDSPEQIDNFRSSAQVQALIDTLIRVITYLCKCDSTESHHGTLGHRLGDTLERLKFILSVPETRPVKKCGPSLPDLLVCFQALRSTDFSPPTATPPNQHPPIGEGASMTPRDLKFRFALSRDALKYLDPKVGYVDTDGDSNQIATYLSPIPSEALPLDQYLAHNIALGDDNCYSGRTEGILRNIFTRCIHPVPDEDRVIMLGNAIDYCLRQILLDQKLSNDPKFVPKLPMIRLLFDWSTRINPLGVGVYPPGQRNSFLDIFFGRHGDSILHFQRYGLSLCAHEGSWRAVTSLINDLLGIDLSPRNIFSSAADYHPTLVLDFLRTCLDLPRIWQGRDMRNKKKYENELILDISDTQFNALLVYMLREMMIPATSSTPSFSINGRLHIVEHCLGNKPTLLKSCIQYICAIVCHLNKGSDTQSFFPTDPSSLPTPLSVTYDLAYLIYLAFPRSKYLFEPSRYFDHMLYRQLATSGKVLAASAPSSQSHNSHPRHGGDLLKATVPIDTILFKVLVNGLESNIMQSASDPPQQSSNKDVSKDFMELSAPPNTYLSGTEDASVLAERAKGFLLCVARFHPHLILRQLPVIAALLKGRTHLLYPAFVSKGHFAFFKVVILLINLSQPHIFFYDVPNFEAVLDSFLDFIKSYAVQTFKMAFHVKRIMNILRNYTRLNSERGTKYIRKQYETIRNLGSQYSDIIKSPFWSSQLTSCQSTYPSDQTVGSVQFIENQSSSLESSLICFEDSTTSNLTSAGELRRSILLNRLQGLVDSLTDGTNCDPSNNEKDAPTFLSEFLSYSKSHPDIIESFLEMAGKLMYSDLVLNVNTALLDSVLHILVNCWRYVKESRLFIYDWYITCITHTNSSTVQTGLVHLPQFCQIFPGTLINYPYCKSISFKV